MFCLFTVFLFSGCNLNDEHEDTGFIPVGEWKDDWGGSYNITLSSLEHDDGFDITKFKGNIKEAVDFSKDAGVLIVQITESDTTPNGVSKYIGVYYKNYTKTHVFLANAVDASYTLILKNTLAEAKNTFTVDNVNTHVTFWGSGYNR